MSSPRGPRSPVRPLAPFALLAVACLVAGLGQGRSPRLPPDSGPAGGPAAAQEGPAGVEPSPEGGDPAAQPAAAPEAAPPPVRLNSATRAELESLPGIGPALAARILEFRASHGPFRAASELLLVRGIGPKKWAALRPLVVP